MTLLILIVAVAMTCLCAVKVGGSQAEFEEDYEAYEISFITVFAALSVGLLASVLMLRHSMKEKNRVFREQFGIELSSIRQETCIVFAILMVFDLSYTLRVCWELVPLNPSNDQF